MICLKTSYSTRDLAKRALKGIRNGRDHRKSTPIRTYECPKCGMWHLTSSPMRKFK